MTPVVSTRFVLIASFLCLATFALPAALVTAAPDYLDDTHVHIGHEEAGEKQDASMPDTTAKGKDTSWVVAATHGPADTVRFKTTEGTWISVDVSPDGNWIAFDLLGDIYLMTMDGGAATRVTDGLPYDFQPRFSPDGSRILFTSDRGGSDNVWSIQLDGSDPRPITSDSKFVINSADWSPDGEYVVARKRLTDQSSIGTVELWLYHVMGGSGVQITKKDAIPDANGPSFSPDGRWIYYAHRGSRYRYNRNVYAGIWQIRAYDRKTGNIRPITDGYGGSGRPRLAPDGNTLSFIRRDRDKTLLMLHDLKSGRERVLFDGLDPDMQENFAWTGTYPGYDWTPDGKHIVISYGGGVHAVAVSNGAAVEIPFTAEVEQHVTQALRFPQNIAPEKIRVRMLSWPNQTPDGRRLVFSALGNLYTMDLPDGRPEPLAAKGERAYAPVFSPDGRNLAYVTWSDAEGGHVWVMPSRGGRSRRVTDLPGQYANPVFSPNGKKLAFLRGSGAHARGRDLGDELWLEILWTDVDRGRPEFVISTNNRGSSRRMPRLAWSPESDRIFYNQDEGSADKARTVLASVRPDGTDRQVHLKIKDAEEIVPSPDGRWVIFNQVHQGFIAALPQVGREPVELNGSGGAVPSHKFSEEGADWLSWNDGGKVITWGFGPFFYRVPLSDVQEGWRAKKTKAGLKTLAETAADDAGDADTLSAEAAKPDTLEITLTVPRATPRGVFALTGARLITMNGEEVIERGTVVVRNDKIAAIGPASSVPIPPEAEVFDMSGRTVIPGLVDAHAHLHYDYLDVIPENISAYFANLAYGVTTTHDPSASTYAVFTQSEMVETGVTVGPRIFSTGFILYGADIPNRAPIESLEDARHHIRRLKTLGAFTVKSYMQPRRDQRQWLIEAAREESVMVVPEGGGNLEMNMSMVLDGHTGIEHSLPVAPLYDDIVELMANSGTQYTPTLLVSYGGLSGEHYFYQHHDVWKDEKLLRFLPRGQVDARSRRRPVMAPDDDWHHMEIAAGCKRLVEAGGKVQLGAHGQLQGLGAHWELWALTHGGMTNHDALRCATLSGAEYIGIDRWVGSLEAGKLADMVVLDANPLESIENSNSVRYVIKNGEMFEGETMERIFPDPGERPAFFWETQGEMLSKP